jgi:hypothetical protein
VASKPWAVVFVPIVLAVPPRARLGAFGLAVAIAAVAWAPFLLAEPHATTANNVFVAVDSAWHLFGASDLASSWMRFLDLVVATGLTAIVSRRALPAAVLVAVAWRVALDPATWPYYWAGVVLGALVFDLLGTRSTIPYWTAIAFVVVASAEELGIDGAGRAVLRIAFAVAVLAVALWPRTPARQAAR